MNPFDVLDNLWLLHQAQHDILQQQGNQTAQFIAAQKGIVIDGKAKAKLYRFMEQEVGPFTLSGTVTQVTYNHYSKQIVVSLQLDVPFKWKRQRYPYLAFELEDVWTESTQPTT